MNKTLFLAWQEKESMRRWFPLGRLDVWNETDTENALYRFRYIKGLCMAQEETGIFRFLPFLDPDTIYEAEENFALFKNRVMNRKRPDFDKYLEYLNLPRNATDTQMLSVSGGYRATDNFEIFPKIEKEADGSFQTRFFLHGLKLPDTENLELIDSLGVDSQLSMDIPKSDSSNVPVANIKTKHGEIIGQAPCYLASELSKAGEKLSELTVKILRKNPIPAPLKERILLEVGGNLGNYKPMSSEEFTPIARETDRFATANSWNKEYTDRNADSYHGYVNYLSQRNQHNNLVDHYTRVINIDNQNSGAYHNLGIAKAKLGLHKEALKDYDKAIKIDPNRAREYYSRGYSKAMLGRHQEALKDFDEAIKIDPDFAQAYNNRGSSKAALGRYQEVLEDVDKAIKIDPDLVDAYNNRGNSKAALGRHKEALEDFDKAIEIDSSYALAYHNRGNSKAALGRHKEALEDFDKAISINLDLAHAYNSRGNSKAALGQYKEALEDFDKAIEIDSSYAHAYHNRGYVKAVLGRYQEALEDFDKAININPQDAETYRLRAISKEQLGDESGAQEDLAMYEKLKDKGNKTD